MTSQSQTVQNSFLDQLIGSTVHSIRSSLTQPIQLLTSQPSSPTQLALLLPLLASTAQLTFSAAEFLAIRPLVGDNSTAYSSSKARGGGSGGEKEEVFQPRAIQKWWEGFWIPGLGVVVGLGALSVGGGIRGSMMRSRGGGRARGWYLVGSCFALGHFGFGPKVAQIIKTILKGPPKHARSNTQAWLEVHASRTVLADIPAFLCFLLAVMS